MRLTWLTTAMQIALVLVGCLVLAAIAAVVLYAGLLALPYVYGFFFAER